MIIAVVGLGYVGAPLAVELGKHFEVIGFDTNPDRIIQLKECFDHTGEIIKAEFADSQITYTIDPADLVTADLIIVTVPTPVGEANVPDLSAVKLATTMVGTFMKRDTTVVFESTVYPGVTEEICVPILERTSKFKWKESFWVGYSPERINPGDRIHTLTSTTKIVAGDTTKTLDLLDSIYSKITTTYRAVTIKVAEAAKVIENTQRDVNIALMNELSQIFTRLGVDTNDVIDAAASKWNFQAFRPGLVGGHCISVDPYYLSHKAATQGFIADVILSAREVNDSMAAFVASQLILLMARQRMLGDFAVVTIIGCTFKENVTDIRNSKVFAVMNQLKKYNLILQLVDTHADAIEVKHEYDININPEPLHPADAVIVAVPHDDMVTDWDDILKYGKPNDVLVVLDLKAKLNRLSQPTKVELWRP
jgi:UDP-N-acetyl-D-glucosamine/UDP-N-acetyl-D-galactosamine dehydrogenase